MGHIQKVKFKNCYGEEIVFKKHYPLYFEAINTFGISGRFAVQELAFCDGQQTINYSASGKTILAKFAYWDKENDIFMRKKLERVFTPLRPGTLTVYDDWDKYEITVYPSGVPDFSEPGRKVYKWDVNFVADDPYWKRMPPKKENLKPVLLDDYDPPAYGCEKTFRYCGSAPSAPIITFPPIGGESAKISIYITNSRGELLKLNITTFDKPVTVDCHNMSVTDSSGDDCSHYLDANANIDTPYLTPGENTASLYAPDGAEVEIKWYEKFSGVI